MKTVLKTTFKAILGLVLVLVLIIGAYLFYAFTQYHRIPDKEGLKISAPETQEPLAASLKPGQSYKAVTFNIGYGSYPPDYTFFMDGGSGVRARSKPAVQAAIREDIRLMKATQADLIGLQEVDWAGDRSWHVNQPAMMRNGLASYQTVLAQNYDSAYLFYPVTDPIGKAKSGMMTFSKFQTKRAERYQLPIETNFNKFFDLDRAFQVQEIQVANGKTLWFYNTHMSAYIKDDKIRQDQMLKIFKNMETHVKAGDYVICAGDYNHDLAKSPVAPKKDEIAFPTQYIPQGMRVVAPTNAPTNRANGVTLDDSQETFAIIDGFIVSDQVKDISIQTLVNGFKSSDHEPVQMEFQLQ